jgi:hypothetical protein
MVDLNGHEAGNGGYSQRTPTAKPGLLYSEDPVGSRGLVATCEDFLYRSIAEVKKSQMGLANESVGATTGE